MEKKIFLYSLQTMIMVMVSDKCIAQRVEEGRNVKTTNVRGCYGYHHTLNTDFQGFDSSYQNAVLERNDESHSSRTIKHQSAKRVPVLITQSHGCNIPSGRPLTITKEG